MQKKFLFAILPIILLACNFLFPANQRDETPPPTAPKVVTAQAALSTPKALTPEAAATQTTETTYTEPFVIVRIEKSNGDMMTQLASEAQKANSLGLALFIEFDATWCPPCQAVEKSIQAKDPLTMQAFEGVYLIRADVDEWNGGGENFDFEAIPVYYQLDASGKPTGAVIDGGAWNEDIPENFAPVLDKFFHTK